MLSFFSICPHPPIIIPGIGSANDLEKVKKTINGMKMLEKKFKESKTEVAIIISPHGPVKIDVMGIAKNENLFGDFSDFGNDSLQFKFKNDKKICEEIEVACKKEKIPIEDYKVKNLDHGTLVPLFYLTKNLKPEIIPITYSFLGTKVHFLFGKILGKIIKESEKKIGIIASGDLSHRLAQGSQAGYSPRGKEFDKKLIELLKEKGIEKILKLDKSLIEDAGECGYKSIIILLGALSELGIKNFKFENLSYEGPFGVGYLVGNFSKIN